MRRLKAYHLRRNTEVLLLQMRYLKMTWRCGSRNKRKLLHWRSEKKALHLEKQQQQETDISLVLHHHQWSFLCSLVSDILFCWQEKRQCYSKRESESITLICQRKGVHNRLRVGSYHSFKYLVLCWESGRSSNLSLFPPFFYCKTIHLITVSRSAGPLSHQWVVIKTILAQGETSEA